MGKLVNVMIGAVMTVIAFRIAEKIVDSGQDALAQAIVKAKQMKPESSAVNS